MLHGGFLLAVYLKTVICSVILIVFGCQKKNLFFKESDSPKTVRNKRISNFINLKDLTFMTGFRGKHI